MASKNIVVMQKKWTVVSVELKRSIRGLPVTQHPVPIMSNQCTPLFLDNPEKLPISLDLHKHQT